MLEAEVTEIPDLERALLDLLRSRFGDLEFSTIRLLERAAENPEAVAFMEPGRESITYARLLTLARETVATLNGLGFSPSSRIAVVLPATTAACCVHLSIVAGMAVMPLTSEAPSDEYRRYLAHGRVDAVLLPQHQVPAAREAAAQLGIPVIDVASAPDGPVGVFSIVGAPPPAVMPRFAQPEDLAALFFTSGTTDLPRLLRLSQRLLALRAYFRPLSSAEEGPVLINMRPAHHYAGWISALRTVARRQRCTVLSLTDVDAIYRALALYRPATISAPPALVQALVKNAPKHMAEIEQLDLEEITVGSAALPEELYHEARRVFGAAIRIVYALSETGNVADELQGYGAQSYKAGSVGKPHEFVRLIIIGDDGGVLPAGANGEIAVRSPLLFTGYENNPAAGDEAFQDGYFRTGDAGYVDEAGNLFLTGRVKEMINRGGSKVSPVEVDQVLARHPAVAEAAAFGVPHSVLGEDLAAAVVLRPPGATERELRSFAARLLPRYKVPSRFVFVAGLPKTDSGKVKRTALTEQFKSMLAR